MSRTIYTPCHITIFNLFLLSYYINFKRLLIFQQLLHCPNQYWKTIQTWVYTVWQACSLDYSLLTPRWISFLCTKLASGSKRIHTSEIWRTGAGNKPLWVLLVIISSNDLMPVAERCALWYVLLDLSCCCEWVKRQNLSLSEKSKLFPKSPWIKPGSWSRRADQRDHLVFSLLDFCMPALRMACCIFTFKFILVSRIWMKQYDNVYLASHIFLCENRSLKQIIQGQIVFFLFFFYLCLSWSLQIS